jgi:four helix bundle protein
VYATTINRCNVEEAIGGTCRKDFIYKLEIAYPETRESRYWLRLLNESDLLDTKLANSFLIDCDEIMKILTAIINSSKKPTNS